MIQIQPQVTCYSVSVLMNTKWRKEPGREKVNSAAHQCFPAKLNQNNDSWNRRDQSEETQSAAVQSADLSLTERLCGSVGELCMNECCDEERTRDMSPTETSVQVTAAQRASVAAGWWGELGAYLTNDSMPSITVHLRLYNLVGIRDDYI